MAQKIVEHFSDLDDGEEEDVSPETRKEELISYFPDGRKRESVRKVLDKVWPFIGLTENNEVQFLSPGGRAITGPGIIELLQYFVIDGVKKPEQDSRFLNVCKQAGVLKSELYSQRKDAGKAKEPLPKKPKISSWKKLYDD